MEEPRMLQGFHVSSERYTSPAPNLEYHLHFITIFFMSAEAKEETQPLTTPSYSSDVDNDKVKDVVLWRRKKLNITVLVAATAALVLMKVCEFNFLTVISWVAIIVVASIFLYANMLRLLGKEPPNLLRLELTKETATRIANTFRAWIEEAMRWLFLVGAEKEWLVFVGVVAGLWSLSYIGSCMDLLTLVYMGVLVGLTVLLTYVKNEDKIKRFVEWLREKHKKYYEIIDEKTIQKIKSRIVKKKKRE
ncbi:Reticulon protein B13 [Spatholobus suberectus]|nr:Reticulon protein B13 [Spatholobus suberectus]